MEFKFKDMDDVEIIVSSEPHYDLFEGGYIAPEDLLSDQKQIDKVNHALWIVRNFLDQSVEAGLVVVN